MNPTTLATHLQEFCAEIALIEEQYGIKIVADPVCDGTILLVNNDEDNKVVVWLGKDRVDYTSDYASVDLVELDRVIEPVPTED